MSEGDLLVFLFSGETCKLLGGVGGGGVRTNADTIIRGSEACKAILHDSMLT